LSAIDGIDCNLDSAIQRRPKAGASSNERREMTLNALVVSAALLLSTVPVRAQQPDVKETTALLGKGFAELSGWILKAADMVPADKYSYKPAPTVRTFGELLGHIADGSNYFCGRALGRKVQWSDANATGQIDKATVVPKLKEALDACSAAHEAGHVGPLIANFGHANLHYGNMVTYMRLKGIVPPSSEPK
jgi:hypothetical protein